VNPAEVGRRILY